MILKDALALGKKCLIDQGADVESATIDVEFLLSHALSKSITWLKTWPDYALTEQEKSLYNQFIERRQQGEPVAYILGEKAFWTLQLYTNPSTLIPRSETELLVELSLDYLRSKGKSRVLDLGTGTGAIALAIADERKEDEIVACDFNVKAVELTKKNAQRNNIHHVDIIQSDWFSHIELKPFDLIVSNPPYIEDGDPHLKQGDLLFEPSRALVAKDNGLADLKIIIFEAKKFLKSGGVLLLEHGYQQGEAVRKLFSDNGYQNIKTEKDLAGLERVSLGYAFS